ncbi:hypothetical protein ASPVEDRAFT_75682 [Aspergillus versicolor CBS 583.65]|uniref:MARVEL domain-containing protein n=1 Tax=Aspergillus versicolor CBS 583.65 TaxID=1036611 RepID=A0A1L9PYR7_ASPVE|nr:uncharacterized protein ASPVEDRAFT_75682 [Aspergillus versicolor CBS 583.65]OJJ06605.1 hypothetical protein ASPVEDRAFT_75682 [Aspergillus versicolor CBS 583.65]
MNNPYYADDSHKAIIGLRILSIITTLPVFPAVAWTIPAHAKVVNDGVDWGINPGVLAASAFTFLWTTTVLVLRLALKKPIHPGVYVSFDLLCFLSLAAVSIATAVLIEPFFGTDYTCLRGSECGGFVLAGVEWYAVIMSLICCVTEFILLVWACRATDKYRKSRKHAARKENAVAA